MFKKLPLLLTLIMGLFSFAQSNLVIIDRANTTVPTDAASASAVSATGFQRGPNLLLSGGPNGDFTSTSASNWSGTDAASAAAAGDYIEWIVSANPGISVNLNELNLRFSRNQQGPQEFQVYFSTDAFVNSSLPLTTIQTINNQETNYTFTDLGIALNNEDTLTFRVYFFNGGNGRLIISGNGLWSDPTLNPLIGDPGGRLRGTFSTSSADSDIVRSPSFNEPENIEYTNFLAPGGLGPENGVKIAEFIIRDGGENGDLDSDPTILTSITFQVLNPSFIRALTIYDNGSAAGEITTVTSSTTLANLNGGAGILAMDDSSKIFEVYASFRTSVTDNEQIQLTVSHLVTDINNSSNFNSSNGGGAETSIAGDDNRIEVVADRFQYTQAPSDVFLFEVMTPAVQLVTIDQNNNQDFDYSELVSVNSTGDFDPTAITSVMAVDGAITFSNLIFQSPDTDVILNVSANNSINSNLISSSFDVLPLRYVLAYQDFDNSEPEWAYSNAVAFFDNGWGINSFYGIIETSEASPLDNPQFSQNILGENNLNDNPDGTPDFARINFDVLDIAGFDDVEISFDWQVNGYNKNRNDVRYGVIIDGIDQGTVLLFDGSNNNEEGGGTETISIPNGSSTVGFYIEVRNWESTGFSGFDNFRVAGSFNGLIYRNGDWFPYAPTLASGGEDALIFSGNYVADSPIIVNNMIINQNTSVSLNPGIFIQTNGTVLNNGILTLNSTSLQFSSIIPESFTNNGTNNYSRFVNTVGSSGVPGGNDLISLSLMPDSGQSFDEFIALGTPENSSKIPTNGTVYAFGPWNRVARIYENLSVNSTTPLERGIGYRSATTLGENLVFSGNVFTDDLTGILVSKPTGGSVWNLLGNPYPSYLNSQSFLIANSGVMDPSAVGIYGYNSGTGSPSGSGTTGNFTIVNFVTNNNVNVAPGQGFFIHVPNTDGYTGNVNFTKAMRTFTGSNDFILTRNTTVENLNLRLFLSSSNKTKLTDIYFHENGTLGLDPGYDAVNFSESINSFDLYSHLVEENEGRNMAIQTLSLESLQNARVPLGISAEQGSQLSFGIDYSNLPGNIEVYLEDATNNSFTLLNSSNYVFAANSNLSGTGRFYLNFGSNILSTNDPNSSTIEIFSAPDKKLFIRGYKGQNSDLSVYDLNGRLVYSTKLDTTSTMQEFDLSTFATGVYVVRILDESWVYTEKIILK